MTRLHLELLARAIGIHNFPVIFAIDHPQNPEVMRLIQRFPGNKEIITRPTNYGLTKNILEALKYTMSKTSHYTIVLLDEIMISKDFLKFVNYCYHNFYTPDLLSITGYSEKEEKYNEVEYYTWYQDYGMLITKTAFNQYILPHCTQAYYNNRDQYLQTHFPNIYEKQWNEQNGLIQRVRIQHKLRILKSCVCRSVPIGIYGGRSKSEISSKPYEERYTALKQIMTNPQSVLAMQSSGPRVIQNWHPVYPDWDNITLKGG